MTNLDSLTTISEHLICFDKYRLVGTLTLTSLSGGRKVSATLGAGATKSTMTLGFSTPFLLANIPRFLSFERNFPLPHLSP